MVPCVAGTNTTVMMFQHRLSSTISASKRSCQCPMRRARCGSRSNLRVSHARVALIEAFLLPRWQAARRPAAVPGLLRLQDWAQGLALRAASSGTGRSLRQAERRIKGWTGLPMRELRGLGRAEQAFFRTLAQGDEPVRWTDVAADTGYADQSHLCRETRRVTGFAPAELRQRIAEDESFWIYRIWT